MSGMQSSEDEENPQVEGDDPQNDREPPPDNSWLESEEIYKKYSNEEESRFEK